MLAAGARNQGVVSDQVACHAAKAGAASLLIDGHKLKNHSVPATKVTAGAVQSLRGQRGPRGAQGIQGEQGEQGEQGAPGLSGYVSGTGGADAHSLGRGRGAWGLRLPGARRGHRRSAAATSR